MSVLETTPMLNWSEPPLVLSPADTFKAAGIGELCFEEAELIQVWMASRQNPVLRAYLHDAAAYGLQKLLSGVAFEDVYRNPSPFITDDSL